MTREFPDELLSAFLDGELSPAERAQVERHLATSEADRQLLSELQALRGEVASLPPAAISPDFTDRVVQAAVEEAAKYNPTAAAVSLPASAATRSSRRWVIAAAVASAAALAASILLVISSWRRNIAPTPDEIVKNDAGKATEQIAVASDQFLKALHSAIPAEGEAVVLRLRVSKDVPLAEALDAALVKAGMPPLGANSPTGAAAIAAAYAKALDVKYGSTPRGAKNQALLDATVTAAQALFVEAPLDNLDSLLRDLADDLHRPLQLDAQGMLAFSRQRSDEPEGEPGSASKLPKAGQAFAQQLDAARFRLEKKLAAAANTSPTTSTNPKQFIRVLLLVETE
jgi:hypothetical protein